MILSGEYRSGTYMPSVRVLAEQLNISKSSVHNILTMLQEEGLVRLIPGRGAMICSQHPGCPVLQRFFVRPSDFGTFGYLPVAAHLLDGICVGAENRNAEFTISFSDSCSMTEALITAYSRNEIQGVVYLQCADYEGLIAPLGKAQIPYVIAHDMHGFPAVKGGIDFRDITTRALRYLADHGHRRIGLLAGNPDDFLYAEMIDQFRKVCGELNLDGREEWILAGLVPGKPGDLSPLFRKGRRPDAVFTIRDYRARLLFEAAAEHGIAVPDQLSVISFDNVTWADAASAGLTTFEEPLHELGEQAVAMLQQWVTQGSVPENRFTPVRLIERSSVKMS